MPYQLQLPAALARRGLKVETVPGWQTRGASTFTPRGAVSHWTAGPKGTTTRPSLAICVNGRTGLPGPLCNTYLDRNGVAVVVAAGTANHAGVGGWKGLTGNSQVFGTEAECAGDGDWTAAQRGAYPLINAAYCDLGGFGADMVCGHCEWAPTRKIDIRDWPMPAMRARVAALLANPTPQEADMPLNDADLEKIAKLIRPTHDTLTPGIVGVKNDGQMYAWLRDTAARTAGLETAIKALVAARDDDLDVDALMERIDETVRNAMADTVNVNVTVDDRP